MAFTEDLTQFFDTDDFAVECVVTGPDDFEKTINVIFDPVTDNVPMFGDTNVEAASPSFRCQQSGIVDVERGMTATIEGQAYTIERIAVPEPGVALIYLS